MVCHPSVRCPSILFKDLLLQNRQIKARFHLTLTYFTARSNFQRSSSPKPLGQLKQNFMWSLHGSGEQKFVRGIWVTWPWWPPRPYMVKTLKISSPEPKGQYPWALVCSIEALGPSIFSNDDYVLTLTYFMTRSNLVPYAFIWENLSFNGRTLQLMTRMTYDICLHKNSVPRVLSAPAPGL